jgi:hypothetical protein
MRNYLQILTPEEVQSQWNLTRIYNPFSLPELQIWTDEANATEAMGQVRKTFFKQFHS